MLNIKNLRFKTKLSSLIGTAVAGLLILGMTSYFTLERVRVGGPVYNEMHLYFDLDADLCPPNLSPQPMRSAVRKIALETDAAKLHQDIAEFQETKKNFEAARDRWRKELPEGEIKEVATVKNVEAAEEYIRGVEQELIPAALQGDKQRVMEEVAKLQVPGETSSAAAQEADKMAQAKIAELGKAADESVGNSFLILAGIGVVVGVVVCFFGFAIARSILGPLARTVETLQAVADGDLRHQIEADSSDEIGIMGQALNKAIHGMADTIQSIAHTAVNVANASEEISVSATQTAQGSDTQKMRTSQVAVAMTEMSTTVHEVSEHSTRAAEASRQAAETAREGGIIVEESLAKMRAIASSVSATAKKVEELGKSSDQIGRIIGVIDDIADQTNLLALNAAIEAARAGEQGRGFAVVADEVRKLAERTTSATKEVAQMVQSIQGETKTAVAAMHEGTDQVQAGVSTTARAGDSLKQIIHMSEQVGDMITHIATAATEQSSATEEINKNVAQIARLIGESAVGAQQSAKACQELSELALDLQKMVGSFRLEANTSKTAAQTHNERAGSAKSFAAGA
ncbi:MAG TPA: methyl-accepting chemotaxis protein [Candidatus Acidoferrales bacterium]|nr:methyl-accepting chemotaxis protein [Candidatus Acidoferrales bacterium]